MIIVVRIQSPPDIKALLGVQVFRSETPSKQWCNGLDSHTRPTVNQRTTENFRVKITVQNGLACCIRPSSFHKQFIFMFTISTSFQGRLDGHKDNSHGHCLLTTSVSQLLFCIHLIRSCSLLQKFKWFAPPTRSCSSIHCEVSPIA